MENFHKDSMNPSIVLYGLSERDTLSLPRKNQNVNGKNEDINKNFCGLAITIIVDALFIMAYNSFHRDGSEIEG